jgi:hypothetical protein
MFNFKSSPTGSVPLLTQAGRKRCAHSLGSHCTQHLSRLPLAEQHKKLNGMSHNHPRNLALARPIDVTGGVIAAAQSVATRHPIKLGLNFLGLFFLFFFSGLSPTAEQRKEFVRLQPSMQDMEREAHARETMESSLYSYRQSQGWFWSCDAACQRKKQHYERDQHAWEAAHSAVEGRLIEANSKLGIFSSSAVEETKSLFWSLFSRGMAQVRLRTPRPPFALAAPH